MRRQVDDVQRQYALSDPLKVRIETHRLYEERAVDLDVESATLLGLTGAESILDAGCGPGKFLLHLRRSGHSGRLVGLDQSPGMIQEAVTAARLGGFEIEGLVGDAMGLPFGDGKFDWVIGRHMLYHVPDIVRVLQEFARVARQGLLLSTNGQRNLELIDDLIDSMLVAFGSAPVEPIVGRFGIENAAAHLASAGLDADETIIDNALVFTEVEPIVRYAVSCLPSLELPDDPRLLGDMESWMREEALCRLDALGGVWRDPKRTGFYVVRFA